MSAPPADAVYTWIASHHRRLAGLRGQGVVVKVGGSIQDDPGQMRAVMRDVAALASLGSKPVVIHGGGKAITAAMNAAGLVARFVDGQRYTDDATLRIVERVLVEEVNRELVEHLREEGCAARGLHPASNCVVEAERIGAGGAPGQGADLGLVGRVTRVNVPVILGVCEAGEVPVIAPVAFEASHAPHAGREPRPRLNVNADVAAGTIAAALHPSMFVLVSDTPGVRATGDTYPQRLTRADAHDLITRGVIAGGMLPKIRSCFEALDAGVRHVAILDGRASGALLGAAITRAAQPIVGTWIGDAT
ncbi:MAG: acetylglutamate kinase [Phycisphaerales bacterium]